MDVGRWARESIILRGSRPIDPDEALEQRLSEQKDRDAQMSQGKDQRRDRGKEKQAVKKEEREGEVPRGSEAAQSDVFPESEGAGLSTYNDVPSGNGEQARSKEEDRYGFLYPISEAERHYTPVVPLETARSRELKWCNMLKQWDVWIGPKKQKLKERCRKGIPSSTRGKAWQYLCGANEILLKNKGLFDELVSQPDTDIVVNVIDKDLDRTFPSHVLFAKDGSQGQHDLRLVLKAYSFYDKTTGYCQAMAPVAATLLMHMTAEEAFWCMVQICEQYLPGYYSPGLHAFQIDALILKDLLKKYLPNISLFMDSKLPPNPDEVAHKRGLDPVLYCTEWYMSIYSRTLPWPSVLRVWDMFFFEGVKVLHRTALALLSLAFQRQSDREKCSEFFQLTRKLRDMPISVTHEDALLPAMLKFRITRRDLQLEHIAMADRHFSEERARAMEVAARRLKNRSTFSLTSDMND